MSHMHAGRSWESRDVCCTVHRNSTHNQYTPVSGPVGTPCPLYRGTGGSGTALPQPRRISMPCRDSPSSALSAAAASSRFCRVVVVVQKRTEKEEVQCDASQRKEKTTQSVSTPGHKVKSNQVKSSQAHTMNATKPLLRPRRRCSSSRGHMILTLPIGPKRPNSRAKCASLIWAA